MTTGGVSSKEKLIYASRLEQNALRHQWRLRLGILKNRSNGQPSVFELMSASEAVVLTSLQEGFGLPYLEAPAVKRPLIARSLPNVMPDLAKFGFKFPQTYDETWIDPSLFDWRAELARQRRLYARWRERLPSPCRRLAAQPWLLRHTAAPTAIPFSRLTLTAQLEILSAAVEVSWERCAALNQPWLPKWRLLAGRGALTVTPWPARAGHWLGAPAYARQFHNLIESPALAPIATNVCVAAQQVFIRWQPRTPLRVGLERTLAYYHDHKERYL